ncbi:MAG: hypothetical protein A3A80_03700 [Candidatus Terrybacteria bacterium RIFCSPLOWO2_01_FULL_44_24]|uniref:Uncharacterized protein n=1 Tax=Candidatus Terrybacteria bacterium RIFCSPHIGHO2_01_FULL_43_35 TaxID=1802361 RepID=A0A1G2PFX6_9BACT|nr:MAG: hypothetical protein A2828_00030 [Candidatus Terrybacteria bacterium RIFCSPHIGHO2_01_FULL_43_35]OHA49297.1 MAG: hypothetical protein A3B75_02405 [Candidatus Terrybacteria bacterium RIFCSPHIGHO2_02_FULL_43_14]OHA51995.1 MAG: hypothetical protein A3A80_03700 [Candidatus Terrybacteria bacterium RIFCSPLOWO2_01_FULL_44_24]
MFFRYFVWHYGPGLRSFLAAERNYIDFGWYFFSISELTRSLFAPWHRIAEKKPGNIVTPEYWQALWGNIISRVLGSIVRLMTIFIGLFFEAVILLIITILTFIWITAPIIIPIGFFLGFAELSNF